MFKLHTLQKKISPQIKDSVKIQASLYTKKHLSRIPWQVWIGATLIISGSGSFVGVSLLLKLPSAPNCPKLFMPTASASMRLYCAELAANKQTVDNLLEAIELINNLPANHPLRPEIDQRRERWSLEILKSADDSFQSGKLDEAIATAKKIPEHPKVTPIAIVKIAKWQLIWSTAQKIYDTAINYIKNLINLASSVGRANVGSIADLEAAISMAKQLSSKRPLFDQAQHLIFRWTLEIADVQHLIQARNLAAPGLYKLFSLQRLDNQNNAV